jgi:ribosomal protein L11 methyltransferase
MLELFPGGFEEVDRSGGVELVAYTDAGGEERLWQAFGGARSTEVEEGWEERWRDFHQPVQVGGLWVGPPWETAPANGSLAVVIDPGRAFGTGAHPTTQLCLELLQELAPGSLLDVGCGSGVLSIAAALLGYAPVVGVDTDEAAVVATVANAVMNGVDVTARLVEEDEELPPADVVVANISAAAIRGLSGRVRAEHLHTVHLITSGYLQPDEPTVPGYRRIDRRTRDGWAGDLHVRLNPQ